MARLGRGQPFRPHLARPIISAATPTSPTWLADSPTTAWSVGVPYSYTYRASGAPAPTFSVSSGSLPTGLTLAAATGVLSGTPTAVAAFTFEIAATNGSGSVTSPSTTITISGAENAPTVQWANIAATGYLYDINVRPVPATSVTVDRPGILSLWVQVTGEIAGDPYPDGTLALTVTPDTGVTITDNNFDGTGNANNIGDGTAAENASSQGQAGFQVSFADAGTVSVSVVFTSADPNYSDASLATPLTVVVT